MQRAIPHLANRGFALHVIEPPRSEASRHALDLSPHANVTLEVRGPVNRMDAAKFLARNLFSILPILLRYVPALVRAPGFTVAQLLGMVAWCSAAERVMRKARVDIVHAIDYPWQQGAAALWASRRFKARSVLSTFGEVVPHRAELRQFDSVSGPFRSVSRYVVSRVDAATSMTQHCREQVAYLGLSPRTVTIVRYVVGMLPFTIDRDSAVLRRRYVDNDGFLLLYVGQVRPRKGPETLIRALPAVLTRHPGAKLLIVGPDHGGHARRLQQLAVDLRVSDAVEFVGAVADDILPSYYAACDVFLFPTITPIECLGLTFVQAMFAGKPVIATRIAGAPEVIREGVDGFFVTPGAANEFAGRINEMLGLSPEERQRIGENARERVRSQFPEEDVMNDAIEVYQTLLDHSSVAP